MITVADGDLIFRGLLEGEGNQEVLEQSIAWPIVRKIMIQIAHHCKDSKEEDIFRIQWKITKGTSE